MTKSGFVDDMLRAGSRTWRLLAPKPLRGAARPVAEALARRRISRILSGPQPEVSPGPLVVSGFFSETRGVSQAARLTLAGLGAAGFKPIEHDLRPLLASGPGKAGVLPGGGSGGVWLLHANPPDAIMALGYLDPATWAGRYRIGYWVYELPAAPRDWAGLAKAFHEIWTPSRFSADAIIASGVAIPVRVMPHPITVGGAKAGGDREAFGIPAGDFVVLVMADLNSSAARKNLAGAIEIYTRAFPGAGSGTRLVVKAQPSDAGDSTLSNLKAGATRPDIVWIEERLSSADTHRLVASCDVLLSPHRSEGFGLHLAESFMAGVPALATGWSGNLDFMQGIPELLVRYTLSRVSDPQGIYPAKDVWAEPDIGDAVGKLRALAASPALRDELAARGKAAVEKLSEAWTASALSQSRLAKLASSA